MNNFHSDSDERRYLPRWEVRNRILFQLENSTRVNESVTKDLHAAGTSFFSKHAIDPKKTVKLTIYLSPDVAITVKGHVAWSKALGKDENLLGVEFDNINEKVQDKILEHAFELSDDALMRSWYKNFMNKSKKKSSVSKI